MAMIVILAVLAAWAAALSCIPLSYSIRLHIGEPVRFGGDVCWFGRALQYTWDYTYGQRPVSSFCLAWKRRSAEPDGIPANSGDAAADPFEPWQDEKTDASYDELKDISTPAFHWKPYVLNPSFAAAFFCWIRRIVHHSRIRTLRADGVIGLKTPCDTGILAGLLYAAVPDAVDGLSFNYLCEEYDCMIFGSGRLYPAVFILYSAAFILSRPVRRLLVRWHASNRGAHHG